MNHPWAVPPVHIGAGLALLGIFAGLLWGARTGLQHRREWERLVAEHNRWRAAMVFRHKYQTKPMILLSACAGYITLYFTLFRYLFPNQFP